MYALDPIEELLPFLIQHNIEILEDGIVTRTGAIGQLNPFTFGTRIINRL